MSVARFIADQRTKHRVPHTIVCALLGVSLAWFYKWRARATGPAADSIGNFNFALANLGAAILVTPFVATSMALHYLDARIRKEGFDLALQRVATADMEARS